MKRYALIAALCFSTSVLAALPGVTELRQAPEALTDAELTQLLQPRIAAADVVAIGETVHGSSAFLRVQARLIRYLVEHHGLRLIVWETGVLRSLELTHWLASCTKGKAPVPIDVLYMPTAADLPLFEWMCDYNRAHPQAPIVFRGMDVWDRPWEHYSRIDSLTVQLALEAPLRDSVQNTCPGYGARSWGAIERLYGELHRDGRFLPEAGYARCRAALTAILDKARRTGAENRKANEGATDAAYELALSASTLLGWLGFYNHNWSDDVLSWNERDLAQGRNLMLLMEKHGVARAILSAHTSHVSHNRSPADWWGYGDLKSGVYFYERTTGRKVFNIALTAYEASGTQGHWLLPTARRSLDKKLHDAGHAFAFFFADAPFLREYPKWWLQNGNAERFENGIELVPADHFDAFIFFDRSLVDKELPKRDIWQP